MVRNRTLHANHFIDQRHVAIDTAGDSWGWAGIFTFLAASVLIAGLLMVSKWNALPGKV